MKKNKRHHKKIDSAENAQIKEKGKENAEIAESETKINDLRPYGLSKGIFVVPNDFDAPLPEDVLADFEN